ncbi:MAG: NADH-quinone oxidoreductase subunit H [Candidatus Omnitrophica bacterium]|nr:NADH-quinone oxidoreductase subunit H [Candidatus Omnitrophota bacterium]
MIYIFVCYGFLLSAMMGLIASWVDRKLTARIQYRVGPPFFQPWFDLIKLSGKELLIPTTALRQVFLTAPVFGLASVILASTILWLNDLHASQSFVGDLIVVVYLLMIPSICIMIGGFASGNPLAGLGSSREMKLILSYELPFILAVLVPVIKSGYSLRLNDILAFQMQHGVMITSLSGFLAFLVCVLCIQAKLGLVPFDMPEAETEIVGGPLIEYSGICLAIFKLMKYMLLFVLPFFVIILFWGGWRLTGVHLWLGLLKYIIFILLVVVIRNTNPRVRVDQAMRFFWGTLTGLSSIAVLLAWIGK